MKSKDTKFDVSMLFELFFFVDNACLLMQQWVAQHWLSEGKTMPRPRSVPKISESEILTILIFYHYSGYKCFEYYYKALVLNDLKTYFPTAPSYNYFIELIERVALPMAILAKLTCQQAEKTGIYYIDAKALPVCDMLRAKQHKVFAQTASKGKSSMGWFFGFKLHLIVNHKGQIVDFALTTGQVADNSKDLLNKLLEKISGTLFGDKGYLTTLWNNFFEKGLKIITKVKKNMKNRLMSLEERLLLKKRPMIEAINDILTSVLT
ncbi:MAG: IS982 family transposase [Sphingobacteriales bacterium]|nr:IS982 family transposase [Sphingobacteriales bacterium]MBK8679966.1 IS982 family transposase [Sphingobacteriales bacterium]